MFDGGLRAPIGASDAVNFLAHAHVARHIDHDPDFVLGAVLPDLLPMAGVRLDRSEVSAPVAAGWAEHHRADAAFHASADFAVGVQALRTDLRATEMGTGPRRAAAHVGWELLLDDVVAGDAVTIVAFRAALAQGRAVTHDARWHELLDRFGAIRASGPTPAHTLAERVQRACSRRARLAFDDTHLAALADVLGRHRAGVERVGPDLLTRLAGR